MDTPDHHNTPSRHVLKFYERGKIDVIKKNIYVKTISITPSIKRSNSNSIV